MKWLKTSGLIILIGMSSVSLSGCSSLGALDFLSPNKPSVEANVQLGKTNEQEQNNIKLEQGKTEQTADTISNDTSYKADVVNQIANELTWWQMLAIVILAGAALPSWREMGTGFKSIAVEFYRGVRFILTDIASLVIIPCKGLANFILKLIGRETL